MPARVKKSAKDKMSTQTKVEYQSLHLDAKCGFDAVRKAEENIIQESCKEFIPKGKIGWEPGSKEALHALLSRIKSCQQE